MKSKIEAKNGLEHACYQMKQTVTDDKVKDKIDDNDKKTVTDKCEEILRWLDDNQDASKED